MLADGMSDAGGEPVEGGRLDQRKERNMESKL